MCRKCTSMDNSKLTLLRLFCTPTAWNLPTFFLFLFAAVLVHVRNDKSEWRPKFSPGSADCCRPPSSPLPACTFKGRVLRVTIWECWILHRSDTLALNQTTFLFIFSRGDYFLRFHRLFNHPLGFRVWCRQTLTVLHERLGVPVVVSASVLVPHVGVVRLGVLVLDPSRGGGDGDYVKNNGEEQQQGHDPPAAGVGDPTAKHDRRSEFLWSGGRETADELCRWARWSPVCYRATCASWRNGTVRGCGVDTRREPHPMTNETCFGTWREGPALSI